MIFGISDLKAEDEEDPKLDLFFPMFGIGHFDSSFHFCFIVEDLEWLDVSFCCVFFISLRDPTSNFTDCNWIASSLFDSGNFNAESLCLPHQ